MNPENFELLQASNLHPLLWKGKDISGNEYEGSGMTSDECLAQSQLKGSSTCHIEHNPAYVAPPEIAIEGIQALASNEAQKLAAEYNKGYALGYADADRKYQDVKALIQLWATELAANSTQDVDEFPFVLYVRNNE